MKTPLRTTGIFACAATAVFLLNVGHASAASSACIEKSRLTGLKTVSAGDLDGVRKELQSRKDLLKAVLQCAIADTREIRSQVDAQKADTDGAKEVKDGYLEKLDKAISYYNARIADIDTAGVRGSQDVAKSVKEWRAGDYASLTENTVNAVVWLKNQGVFRAADARYSNIDRAIHALKLIDTDDIQGFFAKAGAAMSAARAKNEQARTMLRDFQKPEDITGTIKESLSNLADAYAAFADISDAVKKILTPAQ